MSAPAALARCILESPFAAPKDLRDARAAAMQAASEALQGVDLANMNYTTHPAAALSRAADRARGLVWDAEQKHLRYLRALAHYALAQGLAPFASHALYPQWLDDHNPEQRALGIKAGFAWAQGVEIVLVGADLGVSTGMELGIKFHEKAGRDVRIVHLGPAWGRTRTDDQLRWGRRVGEIAIPPSPRQALPDVGEIGERP